MGEDARPGHQNNMMEFYVYENHRFGKFVRVTHDIFIYELSLRSAGGGVVADGCRAGEHY